MHRVPFGESRDVPPPVLPLIADLRPGLTLEIPARTCNVRPDLRSTTTEDLRGVLRLMNGSLRQADLIRDPLYRTISAGRVELLPV